MMNESVKKSLEKSKNVLEEQRKIVKRKNCIKKTHTFTIIAMNCFQEQLKILSIVLSSVYFFVEIVTIYRGKDGKSLKSKCKKSFNNKIYPQNFQKTWINFSDIHKIIFWTMFQNPMIRNETSKNKNSWQIARK